MHGHMNAKYCTINVFHEEFEPDYCGMEVTTNNKHVTTPRYPFLYTPTMHKDHKSENGAQW